MKQAQLRNYWQRLNAFAEIIYEPKQHFLFAALWFLSIQGLFILKSPVDTWQWGLSTLISAGSFFGVCLKLLLVRCRHWRSRISPDAAP